MRLVELPGTGIFVNPEYVVAVVPAKEPADSGPFEGKDYVTVRLSHQVESQGERREISRPGYSSVTYDRFGVNVHEVPALEIIELLTNAKEGKA